MSTAWWKPRQLLAWVLALVRHEYGESPCECYECVFRYIHDDVAESEERRGEKGFSKEVRYVVHGGHEGDTNTMFFDKFTNEEVTSIYMLHTSVMLRIIGNVNGRLVVDIKVDGSTTRVDPELVAKRRQVHGLFCCIRSSNYFCIARR